MYQLRDNRGRGAPRPVTFPTEPVACPWPTAWTPGCDDDDGPWLTRPSPLARIDRKGRSSGYGRFLRIILKASTPAQLMRLWNLANAHRGGMEDGIRRVVDGALADQAVRVAQAIGGRARIEVTVQALIGTLDLIDGDGEDELDEPDEENGDESDHAGAPLRWSLGAHKLAEHRDADAYTSKNDDDEDDDPTEEDDPAGDSLDVREGPSWNEGVSQVVLMGGDSEDDEPSLGWRGHATGRAILTEHVPGVIDGEDGAEGLPVPTYGVKQLVPLEYQSFVEHAS